MVTPLQKSIPNEINMFIKTVSTRDNTYELKQVIQMESPALFWL